MQFNYYYKDLNTKKKYIETVYHKSNQKSTSRRRLALFCIINNLFKSKIDLFILI